MSNCPADNKNETDPTSFWDNGPHFDAHRIGWTVSGLCALFATLISFYLIIKHCQNYHKVIFFSFWQDVLLSILAEVGVIKETKYWTSANISRGLNALLICLEMVIFAFLHIYAFDYRKYRDIEGIKRKHKRSPISKGILDAFNPKDIYNEIKFVCKYIWYLISGKKLPDSTNIGGGVRRKNVN
ncbi:11331_t:CDS:2 [Diversispora eburnea]|uniref:11331_t:CDS:1 n=1 Tax=Diversispora eburnea TaxID=1213867 RepID=A0A9N8YYU8_9GLOM|nr:11331_t:CDS:2 [Diversispora eburnea]